MTHYPAVFSTNTTSTISSIPYLNEGISSVKLVDSIDPEVLWEKMYAHAKKVIVKCDHCGAHNAVSNPTCVRCGAPFSIEGK